MTVLLHRTTRDLLTVSGPEAIEWLQGQLSQDVVAMATGAVAWTFVLGPQGKVDGWGRVQRISDDAVRIDVDPGAGEPWAARLQRFKLRTKADIELRTDVDVVAVRGARLDGDVACGWAGSVGGDLIEPPAELVADLLDGGAIEIDEPAYEALRIRAGIPRWGAELDADTIPATAGQWVIDASVSFTKGCFTGQELVARIDSRGGKVPRRLAAVLTSGAPPAPGTVVNAGGSPAGSITSSAPDAVTGGAVALALVARSVDIPAEVEVAGRPAAVAEVPLPTAT
ncbi:folate-binding protein YgfZ [soil metagenome]